MSEEMVDIVDENDNVIGKATRKEAKENFLKHRYARVIVLNGEGKILAQKRAKNKQPSPGYWDIGMTETVKSGESYEEAAQRGLIEELGINNAKITFLFKRSHQSLHNNAVCSVYKCTHNEKVTPSQDEVEETRFLTETEFRQFVQKEPFTYGGKLTFETYLFKPIDIVDENDKVIGTATWQEAREKGLTFRAANVLVFNNKGAIFVHRRSRNLPTFPGMWDFKLGGIVDAGESYEEAAIRELKEEAGIDNAEIQYLFSQKYRNGKHKVNRKVYKCIYNGKIRLQKEEIEEGKFVAIEEAKRMMKEKDASPTGKSVLEEFLKWKK